MKLRIYDPGFPNGANEYVSKMFFDPMMQYGRRNGHEIGFADQLIPEIGCTFICNADHLNAEIIAWFYANEVPLIAFSCIDSAYLSESLRTIPQARYIKKIFMVSGVQNTNTSNATVFHEDGTLTAEPRRFLPDDLWETFDSMRQEGRLQSLPYVPWRRLNPPAALPFDQKRPTILWRGGNHFLRVLGYYMSLARGCADPMCAFHTFHYFMDEMNPQFRYCDTCRKKFKENGNRFPLDKVVTYSDCTSPAMNETAPFICFKSGLWNNRCPATFNLLAAIFENVHGKIDHGTIEGAMNARPDPNDGHMNAINGARFYGECKWEFSINMPQRFWEAASVGTVNLLPARSADQDYFPVLKAGEHFSTFNDDMSNLGLTDCSTEYFQGIADNARAAYREWMEPTDHAISSNLLRHIFDQILE